MAPQTDPVIEEELAAPIFELLSCAIAAIAEDLDQLAVDSTVPDRALLARQFVAAGEDIRALGLALAVIARRSATSSEATSAIR